MKKFDSPQLKTGIHQNTKQITSAKPFEANQTKENKLCTHYQVQNHYSMLVQEEIWICYEVIEEITKITYCLFYASQNFQ